MLFVKEPNSYWRMETQQKHQKCQLLVSTRPNCETCAFLHPNNNFLLRAKEFYCCIAFFRFEIPCHWQKKFFFSVPAYGWPNIIIRFFFRNIFNIIHCHGQLLFLEFSRFFFFIAKDLYRNSNQDSNSFQKFQNCDSCSFRTSTN